ncbi:MAG: ABC transporter permease [Prochlorococcus sp. SP3034]|nr:ABC transporter permease [Prochlorococcus sp. SP3034]|tara:strand:- start:5861 stop:6655 length:795 start_codon:yes stop_codon:yes gene_type:complete
MNIKKYSKIYFLFNYTSLAIEMEYKINILIDVITAIIGLIGSIFLLSIFFANSRNIGGWSFEQALIIQSIYTILNGVTNSWFSPNLTEIVKYIREGTLDFVLIKPIDSQFWISCKRISPSGLIEIILGLTVLVCCIYINKIPINISLLFLLTLTLVCAISILYSLWFLISTTTIWFVKTWNATEVLRSFLYIGRFPLNSFSFSLRIFFSTVIPITFITTIPSELILGIAPIWKIILEVFVSYIFITFSRRFWKYALRFYTSASS